MKNENENENENEKISDELDLKNIAENNDEEIDSLSSEMNELNEEELFNIESDDLDELNIKFDELDILASTENIDNILNKEMNLDFVLDNDVNLSDEQLQLADEGLLKNLDESYKLSLSKEFDDSSSIDGKIFNNAEPKKSIIQKIVAFMYSYKLPIIIITSIATVAVFITVFFINNHLKYLTNTEFGRIYISQPNNAANNLNHIYVNRAVNFNDNEMILVKMMLGTKSTVFYFDEDIDIYNNIITLQDDNGEIYNMEYSFNTNSMNNFNSTSVLRFMPISNRAKEFILSIHDKQTGEVAGYHFRLDSYLKTQPVKYGLNDVTIIPNTSNIKLELGNMVFSNSMSRINYKLSSIDGLEKFVFRNNELNNYPYLREGSTIVKLIDKLQTEFYFEDENIAIGTLEFDPLYNLNSNIELILNNIYLLVDYDEEILADNLIHTVGYNTSPHIIRLPNYEIFLESVVRNEDNFALILYGEDTNLPIDILNPRSRRVNVELDAKLIAHTVNGQKITFNGINKPTHDSTLITFDSLGDFVDLDSLIDFSIQINSILIKQDTVNHEINVGSLSTVQEPQLEKLEQFIMESFNSRLNYMAKKIDKTEITGFDDSIINSQEFYSYYEQIAADSLVLYSPNILTYFNNDNGYVAIVQETIGYKGPSVKHDLQTDVRTHKINVVSVNDEFIIDTDKIFN